MQRLARVGDSFVAYHRHNGRADVPGVIFLNGYRSVMEGIKARSLEEFCKKRERSFVRFDWQGHGSSSGTMEEGTIGLWLSDALLVLDSLTQGPQILVGSSMGGWIGLLIARARPERISGFVGVGTGVDFTEKLLLSRLSKDQRQEIQTKGYVTLESKYDPNGYIYTWKLIEEARQHLFGSSVPVNCAVRLLHGVDDTDVNWKNSLDLSQILTSSDVALLLIKGGDHRLSRPQDIDKICAAVDDLTRINLS